MMKKSDASTNASGAITTSRTRFPGIFSYGFLPVTIMTIVIFACFVGYSLASANLEALRTKTIDEKLSNYKVRFSSVMDSYARLSWGSSAFLQSSGVNETAWKTYINSFNIAGNYAGMDAIGVTTGSQSNNTLTFALPEAHRMTEIVGTNLGQQPKSQAAMERAAKSDQTIITDAYTDIFPVDADADTLENGFLMFTPFYDTTVPRDTPEGRLQALRGFTVASFKEDSVFGETLSRADSLHTHIEIYLGDVKPENLLYQFGKNKDQDVRKVRQDIVVYGKTFTILYSIDTEYVSSWATAYFPQFVLFGGLGFGLLFASLSGYMLRNRYFRLTYEKERDVAFAKDELLSLASHQLRTPATGVKQYIGMVLQGFAGDITTKQREYLQRAYASNNRQLGVINDILHLAKLETGRIVLAERKFDIAKMVRDVVDEQRESAEKGGIALSLDAPSSGSIMADSHMLRMVIENLLSNAIKYTPEGGSVDVRLARRGTKWVLMIKDTGVGIAKSDFPKLFKQFTRINNSRTDLVTGTGVGLYLAYHLTILHGGMIDVASQKGKGSTFTLRLPRKIQ